MVGSLDLVGNTMKEIFIFETDQQLSQLEEILLQVEKNQSFEKDEISEVFRIMHTIKGSSAMMDYTNISLLSHSAESLFNIIRENNIEELDYEGMCDIILDVTQFIKGEMFAVQEDRALEDDPSAIISKIDTYISTTLHGEKNDSTTPSNVSIEPTILSPNAYQIRVYFDEEAQMENMRAFTLVRDLKKHCTEISYYPEDIDTNNETKSYIQDHGFELFIESSLIETDIRKIVEKASFVKNYDVWNLSENLELPTESKSSQIEIVETLQEATSTKFYINVYFDEEAKMENMRAFQLVREIKKKVIHMDYFPVNIDSDMNTTKYIQKNGFDLNIETTLSESEVRTIIEKASFMNSYTIKKDFWMDFQALKIEPQPIEVKQEEVKEQKIELPKVVEPKKVVDKPKENNDFKNVNQSVISVNITKLDKVMDLIGEISVMQSVIINRGNTAESQTEVYNAITRQLVKLTNELRDTVMSIRLLPVSIIFSNVNRIIRDMKRSLNKDVDFIVHGEETVLDKKIIDNLFDPIIHIVRNCMDHGIETLDERKNAGKDPKGKILVNAESSGGYVTITITDDGKGIDKEKVLNKALSLGALTKSPDTMTDSEILALIFESGLSTKQEVTEYSGRGVGMDIVKNKVEEMSGNIFVESVVGQGSTFTIKVPLTLAILEGVKIQVGEAFFIVPSKMIEKTFKVYNDQIIVDNNNNQMIMMDEHVYPIVKLSEYLNIPSAIGALEDGIMILVREDKKYVCLFVDVILGEIESIIKPLPKYLSRFSVKENGISGCTKLENGDLCLILDVSRIVASVL